MLKKIMTPKVRRIFALLNEAGATRTLLVGGCVRDALLGAESKDIDIEVYGISYDQIADALAPHFRVDRVGKSFGVLKVGHDIDIALPRTESKAGSGHTGFDVISDPYLDPKAAFARRDFTINAIGLDPEGRLVDYYGGQDDLERKVLRATSSAFKDDPLRVLRGMQFAARFGMTLDEPTARFCRELLPEFATLSPERIYEEWLKWALKGNFPSLGLDLLDATGWIDAFPELAPLKTCEQNPAWHPEGVVWAHTKLVVNEVKKIILEVRQSDEPFSEEEETALMFAALCHDFGKPATTARDSSGVIRSHGHAEAGVPLADSFLSRMRTPNRVTETVRPLVAEHMAILNTHKLGEPSLRAVRRLAVRLAPANVRLWCALCQADALGCFPPATSKRTIRFQADVWLRAAEDAQVKKGKQAPLLQGRDLIPLGVFPGPELGRILDAAYEAQLDGAFDSTESAIAWFLKNH